MHLRAWSIALAILWRESDPAHRNLAYGLLAAPMDSVRYFELDFAWRSIRQIPLRGSMVDVSSPRLLPVALLFKRPDVEAVLVNPDPRDLSATQALVAACRLSDRCSYRLDQMRDLRIPLASTDLVTSISVVEHIPGDGDVDAVARMWTWLRPGGRLTLTVPCAREPFEEYSDLDEYGLLAPDEGGFVFGQRFYDERMIRDRFFRTCGPPTRIAIFGERRAGTFFADRERKLMGRAAWAREPYAQATGYRNFESIETLPGVGIAAMEFTKPSPYSA
jgi:SAM-dependent methyltransferase